MPPGTASHTRIRLKGKGIRRVNGFGNGDHYIHVKVKMPVSLTKEQEALLKAYAELEVDTPGTVKGVTKTTSGKFLNIFNGLYSLVFSEYVKVEMNDRFLVSSF